MPASDPVPTVPVIVEVFALSVHPGGLAWSVTSAGLPGLVAPDVVARELAAVQHGAGAGVVLHSTSWRHTGTHLIVTYALFPDLRTEGRGPSEDVQEHLVAGPGPLQPTPECVAERHVAAHAVRHLADLAAGRDPHVVASSHQLPEHWRLLHEHARAVHVHHGATPVPALSQDDEERLGATGVRPWKDVLAI